MEPIKKTEAQAIADLAAQPKQYGDILALPPGWKTEDYSSIQEAPRRQKGFTVLHSIDSFARFISQHGIHENTRIFVTKSTTNLKFTAILNANSASDPGWADWGCTMPVQYDPVALEWQKLAGQPQTQAQLSAFLRSHVGDVVSMPAAALIDLAENLEVKTGIAATYKTNTANGSRTLAWEEDVKTTTNVPASFTIRIPVFQGQDGEVELEVRLTFRSTKEGLLWTLYLDEWRAAVDASWESMVESLKAHEAIKDFTHHIYEGA